MKRLILAILLLVSLGVHAQNLQGFVIDGVLYQAQTKSIEGGGGNNTYNFNNQFSDVPSGTIDGANTTFTVGQSEYEANTLVVYVNGASYIAGQGLTETTPGSGIFTLDEAPTTGDDIVARYFVPNSSATDYVTKTDNDNIVFFQNKTVDGVPSGDDIEQTTGADIGRKTINYADASETLTETLDGSHTHGQSILYLTKTATATITVVPDDGDISILSPDLSGNQNAFTISGIGSNVSVIKTDVADEYAIIGSVTGAYKSFTEWPSGNAATPGVDEANALPTFGTDNGNMSVYVADSQEGSFSILYDWQDAGEDQTVEISGLTALQTYDISFYDKRIGASAFNAQIRIGSEDIEEASLFLTGNATTWTNVTGSFTPSGTSVTLTFQIAGSPTAGEDVQHLFDNIEITPQ